jgi:hypothetical protein
MSIFLWELKRPPVSTILTKAAFASKQIISTAEDAEERGGNLEIVDLRTFDYPPKAAFHYVEKQSAEPWASFLIE